jgi:two-component system, LuxR family, sensor kinase FixL
MTDNTNPPAADDLPEHLQQRLSTERSSLVTQYQRALRDTLFTSRSELRPAMLGRIAGDEADSLLSFLQHPLPSAASERGEQLCAFGLSERAILRLGYVTRRFFLGHLENHLIVPALEISDLYHESVLQGFLQSREKVILSEQERIRSALQKTLNRYTIQMEVAASVAAATTSILDLDRLLAEAVELIRERFDLYYVGVFLIDERSEWAILRAGTGSAGSEMRQSSHRLPVDHESIIGWCIQNGEPRIVLDIEKETVRFRNPLLPDTRSEGAIPLSTRGRVIGAISVQSQRVNAFADQDTAALRILADQLANAIENARLFAELRSSEETHRTILENIEEGYYAMDRVGVFTFINDSFSVILGYPKQELLGMNYSPFIAPAFREEVSQTFDVVYQTGRAVKGIEYQVLRKDGTSLYVETSASLARDAADQPTGIHGIMRDVTIRKQAEQFLIERKALERSNRDLEQFAYVASHDLQEPLHKIQAFSERLKTKSSADLGYEGRDYLERILNASHRMQILIDNLLSLSRVATKAERFISVDLAKVAQEVLADLEAQVEQTGAHVEIGDLPTIEADPLQMRQLLQNLISNALKFHRPHETPAVRVFSRASSEQRVIPGLGRMALVDIVVQDNGLGFDEKYLDRLFQPFQRLHSRGQFAGTGIGLAICARIVGRHAGHITAKSAPGQGATFIATLPVRHSSTEEAK